MIKKFSIGYQLPKKDNIPEIVKDFEEHIKEVYFAFPGDISGRETLDEKHSKIFWKDMRTLEKMDINLALLFNGHYSNIKHIKKLINKRNDEIQSLSNLTTIVTTSFFLAKEVKKRFPYLKIRASVNMNLNMNIKTIKEMKRFKDLFDEFHSSPNKQRNIKYLKKIDKWAKKNDKKIHILVNLGCLYGCSVANQFCTPLLKNERRKTAPNCVRFFSKKENKYRFLQGGWIRPEDVHNYIPYCDTIKIATRGNKHPRLTIESYINQKYYGNFLNITESFFVNEFYPNIINNQKFPSDWFKKTSSCKRNCDSCRYCKDVFELVKK